MMTKILFLFIVYAIIGWLWETPYVSIGQKKYVNRGFLRGPYIPIYGLACLTIILTMNVFDGLNQSGISVVLIQVIYIGLISAAWEYATSWSLEVIFKTRWWDYSEHKFNLNGRIALDYTILFGIGGYILWRFINPVFLILYDSLSVNFVLVLIILFYSVFLLDSYITLKDLFNVRTAIIKLNLIKEELFGRQEIFIEKLRLQTQSSKDHIAELVSALQEFKNKSKGKITESLDTQIANLEYVIKNSKNLSRLFGKFPRTRFNFFEDLKERLNRRK